MTAVVNSKEIASLLKKSGLTVSKHSTCKVGTVSSYRVKGSVSEGFSVRQGVVTINGSNRAEEEKMMNSIIEILSAEGYVLEVRLLSVEVLAKAAN